VQFVKQHRHKLHSQWPHERRRLYLHGRRYQYGRHRFVLGRVHGSDTDRPVGRWRWRRRWRRSNYYYYYHYHHHSLERTSPNRTS
jgi:hypothetical protein